MSNTRLGLICLLGLLIAGNAGAAPGRVVSLDYCADQFLLKLADRAQILALSPDAGKPFSYMAAEAAGIPEVRSRAEDVLVLQPDLVIRSYGGGANAAALFRRAGVPVVQLAFSTGFESVNENALKIGEALGHPERGQALAADFAARLAAVRHDHAAPVETLYMTPSG